MLQSKQCPALIAYTSVANSVHISTPSACERQPGDLRHKCTSNDLPSLEWKHKTNFFFGFSLIQTYPYPANTRSTPEEQKRPLMKRMLVEKPSISLLDIFLMDFFFSFPFFFFAEFDSSSMVQLIRAKKIHTCIQTYHQAWNGSSFLLMIHVEPNYDHHLWGLK